MKTQNFIIVVLFTLGCNFQLLQAKTIFNDREQWVNSLTKIAEPVLYNLSNKTLRKSMPVEATQEGSARNRELVSHLEAVGRTLCGIAPWLELGNDKSKEGILREKYILMTLAGLKNAVDSTSPDFLSFTIDRQALVDAAFLAEGFLRAPTQLWSRLDKSTQLLYIKSFLATRKIKPLDNNWLLFSAMVEAFLYRFTNECKMETIDYALDKFTIWYKGDGWYGDGVDFHFDYYNSLVIHPMIYDILATIQHKSENYSALYQTETALLVRHAEQLERLISPEGTYPAFGRSLAYRFGVFHSLSQVALLKKLPNYITPAQVRSALGLIIKHQISKVGTFDKNGWLTLGFCGHQPEVAESYISTGSLYLCSAVFLPLGLPASDEFWTDTSTDWTNKKAWSGKYLRIDKAIKK